MGIAIAYKYKAAENELLAAYNNKKTDCTTEENSLKSIVLEAQSDYNLTLNELLYFVEEI